MVDARTSFDERLSRIAQMKAQGAGGILLHVGEAEFRVRALTDVAPQAGQISTRLAWIAASCAVPVGAVAFTLAEAVRVRVLPFSEAPQGLSDSAWALGLLLGAVMGALIGPFLGVKSRPGWGGLLVGVLLASMTLHNLAFVAPDKARLAFGAPWVHKQLAATAPASLVFRKQVFVL